MAEMERSRPNRGWRTLAVSAGLLLAACTDSARESSDFAGLPTASELAESQGGSVVELPRSGQGIDDVARYCREIDGEVTGISKLPNALLVICELGDNRVFILDQAQLRDPDTYRDMCRVIGGTVVDVAADSESIQACHSLE